jgi:heme/copper-type cytochrome/quinol oxidase subunit 1
MNASPDITQLLFQLHSPTSHTHIALLNLWLAFVGWGQMCDVIATVHAVIMIFFIAMPILIGGFTIIIIKR